MTLGEFAHEERSAPHCVLGSAVPCRPVRKSSQALRLETSYLLTRTSPTTIEKSLSAWLVVSNDSSAGQGSKLAVAVGGASSLSSIQCHCLHVK